MHIGIRSVPDRYRDAEASGRDNVTERVSRQRGSGAQEAQEGDGPKRGANAPPDPADYFSRSYDEARDRFRAAAADRGATLHDFGHDRFPDLSTDVALLGPARGRSVLVLVSGTHGVEGFAGSACQLRFLAEGGTAAASVVLVHALNPFGFRHRRRVDEDNVDVNRNFVDHSREHPANPGYSALHPFLLPADWRGPDHRLRQEELERTVGALAPREAQAALTLGQYEHPDGLFYGGVTPGWTNRTWRSIVRRHLRGYDAVHYIDLHTGLGVHGGTEPIFRGGRDADALARARACYGDALTESEAGTASSTPIGGNTALALADELDPRQRLTAVTLEFGTLPPREVLVALQADNLLWSGAVADTGELATQSAALMSAAFAPNETQWRAQVVDNGAAVIDSTARFADHDAATGNT